MLDGAQIVSDNSNGKGIDASKMLDVLRQKVLADYKPQYDAVLHGKRQADAELGEMASSQRETSPRPVSRRLFYSKTISRSSPGRRSRLQVHVLSVIPTRQSQQTFRRKVTMCRTTKNLRVWAFVFAGACSSVLLSPPAGAEDAFYQATDSEIAEIDRQPHSP